MSDVDMFDTFNNIHTLGNVSHACYTSKTNLSKLLVKNIRDLKCPTSGEIETFIFLTLIRNIS